MITLLREYGWSIVLVPFVIAYVLLLCVGYFIARALGLRGVMDRIAEELGV